MTDYPSADTTPAVPFLTSTTPRANSLPQLSASTTIGNGVPPEDDEEYTIKCICNWDGDDGSTVQCEKCETWQHTRCYYLGKVPGADEVHLCTDCDEKILDLTKPVEPRLTSRGSPLEVPDRRIKKAAARNTKKKGKTAEHQNGSTYDARSSVQESGETPTPNARRTKASHRASTSMHSTPKFQSHASKHSLSALNSLHPANKFDSSRGDEYDSGLYSPDFLHLYEDDPGDSDMPDNVVNDLSLMQKLTLWKDDADEFLKASNGQNRDQTLQYYDGALKDVVLPAIAKKMKVDNNNTGFDGPPAKWIYLTVDSPLPKDAMVGELRGRIGHMQDYTQDPRNRWDELRHPLPFVFFHKALPVYIDTRREGNMYRYIRRSCQPNVQIQTVLENGSPNYHFCLTAKHDLEPDDELTIGWTLDTHMRIFSKQLEEWGKNVKDGIQHHNSSEIDPNYISENVTKWLSEFGECACHNHPEPCYFAKYDRRLHRITDEPYTRNGKPSKGRKAGLQQASTRSRSGSDFAKNDDDEEMEDAASRSVSSRSKPQSRDITPSQHLQANGKGVWLGETVSDREKRKIAMLEKSEMERQQPAQKKKKRNSGGSAANITPLNTSKSSAYRHSVPNTPAATSNPRYMEFTKTRTQSGSPCSGPRSPPVSERQLLARTSGASAETRSQSGKKYVDACVQTEPGTAPGAEAPRRPFMSLTRRLLLRCHKERVMAEEAKSAALDDKERVPIVEVKSKEVVARQPSTSSPPRVKPALQDYQMQVMLLEAQQDKRKLMLVRKERAQNAAAEAMRGDTEGDMKMDDGGDHTSTTMDASSRMSPANPSTPEPRSRAVPDESLSPSVPLKPPLPPPAWLQPRQKDASTSPRDPKFHISLPPNNFAITSHPPAPYQALPTPSVTGAAIVASPSPSLHTTGMFPPLTTPTVAITQPSPLKKRITLGDYMNRRNSSNVSRSEPNTPVDQGEPGGGLDTGLVNAGQDHLWKRGDGGAKVGEGSVAVGIQTPKTEREKAKENREMLGEGKGGP